MKYNDTWDLESIFPGGTTSEQLQDQLINVQDEIENLEKLLTDWKDEAGIDASYLKKVLHKQEQIGDRLGQASTFVRMTLDAFMDDEHAPVMMGKVVQLSSELSKQNSRFAKKLVRISNNEWQQLLQDEYLKEVSFVLNETRDDGKRLLSEEEEKLIAELNKDGITAWSQLYDTTVSMMTIPFTNKNGEKQDLSIGQAMNRMYADPDPKVRKQLFENWEEEWTHYAPVFTKIINHLAGYRMTLQNAHGRKDHLEEPLEYNRMTKATLDAMWEEVDRNKQPFIDYLHHKAHLLGLEQLAWQDVDAPVTMGDGEAMAFAYDEACDFVIENFASFGEKLTGFTKHALENRWVEAEDRANKRPGGYCTSLPEDKESRIFMTFTGSSSDVSTLAHELGHAFHSHVMKDLPKLNQAYAMNVAETASTFAETIIDNATIKNAETTEEKVALLGSKLETAIAMFMNIRARFLFEDAFYKERREGIVPEKRLNELMVKAQKEAYGNSLATYHPHFCSSKLHFFIESVPFYYFPYTFGYLFSLGVYAQYLKQPEGFEEKYIALLQDTGSMKVEDLAKKHLNVDITKEAFWQAGIDLIVQDTEEFIRLTK